MNTNKTKHSSLYYEKDDLLDSSLRPKSLSHFYGQSKLKKNLEIYLSASIIRKQPLDHILFSGPPGLGKTTLAKIIAETLSVRFHSITAPNLNRPGELVKILSTLEENDILFIDEIHRLPIIVEEVLYSALEDFQIHITMSEGFGASAVEIPLPKFTLIGATTKLGMISSPLNDRFGIQERLEYYSTEEIKKILLRAANLWNLELEDAILEQIACRSRRTPRIALKLLRRISDFAIVENYQKTKSANKKVCIYKDVMNKAFQQMEIDSFGLTSLDRNFLNTIVKEYNGGPVGLKPISAILSEDTNTLENFIEPFLVKENFVIRTSQGRTVTPKAYNHLNISIGN